MLEWYHHCPTNPFQSSHDKLVSSLKPAKIGYDMKYYNPTLIPHPTPPHPTPTWWRHQMETFSALLAICAGNSLVTGKFPAQRSVMRSFNIFSDLHLNKRLCKQLWGCWFEMPSRPLWPHCNDTHKHIQHIHDGQAYGWWINGLKYCQMNEWKDNNTLECRWWPSPDSKVHWVNMGPIWGRQDAGGPHVGTMNFAIRQYNWTTKLDWFRCTEQLISEISNTKYIHDINKFDNCIQTLVQYLFSPNECNTWVKI